MSDLALALLRVTIGVTVASLHGWHKIVGGWQYFTAGAPWPLLDDTVQLGFPGPVVFTVLAAATQFIGALLIAAGAWTRPAAVMVAGTMLTALLFNLRSGGADGQLAALYALVTGVFVMAGGGRWSVDHRLAGRSLRP